MKFPDPEQANADGLLMVGGDLSVETLTMAYRQGIFPWPQEGFPVLWFSPPERGVLFFDEFKIPKSTQKKRDKNDFEISLNRDFSSVIENCARIPRNQETGTWILPEMVTAYRELHRQGQAVSVEAWREGNLVGGLYGVLVDAVFSGESMFFHESEASKVCLVYLVEWLQAQGHEWLDTQMVTPVLAQFGGRYIPRKNFLEMLKERHGH